MDCNRPDENASQSENSGITDVILVRHGETTWNFDGIYQGQLESQLNELGWRQANAVAERLAKESKITALYSSDLKRAFDTATAIGQKCGLQGGGESLNQLSERTTSALEEIGNKHRGERVIIVTHGGVLRALWNFAGEKSSPRRILNASINVIRKDEGGSWFVHSWGDTTHLNEVGVLSSGFGGDRKSG